MSFFPALQSYPNRLSTNSDHSKFMRYYCTPTWVLTNCRFRPALREVPSTSLEETRSHFLKDQPPSRYVAKVKVGRGLSAIWLLKTI
jgi:hypothetical protein